MVARCCDSTAPLAVWRCQEDQPSICPRVFTRSLSADARESPSLDGDGGRLDVHCSGWSSELNTDKKVIDFIRYGSVIGRAPIVSMAHWGGIIPNDQLRSPPPT